MTHARFGVQALPKNVEGTQFPLAASGCFTKGVFGFSSSSRVCVHHRKRYIYPFSLSHFLGLSSNSMIHSSTWVLVGLDDVICLTWMWVLILFILCVITSQLPSYRWICVVDCINLLIWIFLLAFNSFNCINLCKYGVLNLVVIFLTKKVIVLYSSFWTTVNLCNR